MSPASAPQRRAALAGAIVVLVLASAATPGGAQSSSGDRYQRLADMHHTAWTARDGLIGQPSSIAQTTDGFLWVGTSDGLFRFDGVRMERHAPIRGTMGARSVSTLAASPDGGLWVGHPRGGVTFLARDGSATSYGTKDSVPFGRARSIAVDADGVVWLAAVGGLSRFAGGRWQRVGAAWGYPHRSAWSAWVDRAGTLWVGAASPDGVMYLPRGARQFRDLAVEGSAGDFHQLDDSTIVWVHQERPSIHLVRVGKQGATSLQDIERFAANEVAVDANGGIWATDRGISRYRIVAPSNGERVLGLDSAARERMQQRDGLSGEVGTALLIDRERTMWVLTEGGLDRFRHRNLTWRADSLAMYGGSVVGTPRGDVWLVTGVKPSIRRVPDLSPADVDLEPLRLGYAAPDGAIWFAPASGLQRWKDARLDTIRAPESVVASKLPFTVSAMAQEPSGRLWVSISGSGAFVLDGDRWTFRPILDGRPDWSPISMDADDRGTVWLAYYEALAMVRGDSVRSYEQAELAGVTPITTVRVANGQVWVGGEGGLALLHGGRFHRVRLSAPGDVGVVADIVPSSDGIWLSAEGGIVHVAQREVARLAADPAVRVQASLFDLTSDLPDVAQSGPRAQVSNSRRRGAQDRDGILWFLTFRGIARIDPRQVVRNSLAPTIAIRSVLADDSAFAPHGDIRLPALTRTLRIEYAATSLVLPERVRYRHRLEGWQDEWHDAGNRREVTYTDLRPGHYTLRVTASNNDGVWNEEGTSLAFSVAPAWYQTAWFRVLVVVALLAATVAAYRLRIRRISAQLAARYDERLAERLRISRDLHDTLMQTVQGSRIVAADALERPADPAHAHQVLQRVTGWLDQAVQEGRAALDSLRGSSVAESDLAEALRRVADGPSPSAPAVVVETKGEPRELHPVACDEIYRIGCEAIRNASSHARARHIVVELEYGRSLVLRVSDDGVGLDPALVESGRPGHYGLRSMRERAAHIGATLAIDGNGGGTRITLTAPGHGVYRLT
jgi:signal transduction histidine kinase